MLFREYTSRYLGTDSIKILGLKWLSKLDCFSYDGVNIPNDVIITKRVV
jgi:hypothetical protein